LTFYDNLTEMFHIDRRSGKIPNHEGLFSSSVNIFFMNTTIESFAEGTRIEFKVDDSTVDLEKFDLNSKAFCLGRSYRGKWECSSTSLEITDDGFWSFPLENTGSYSVVLNANEELYPLEPLAPEPGPDPNEDPEPRPIPDEDDDP